MDGTDDGFKRLGYGGSHTRGDTTIGIVVVDRVRTSTIPSRPFTTKKYIFPVCNLNTPHFPPANWIRGNYCFVSLREYEFSTQKARQKAAEEVLKVAARFT